MELALPGTVWLQLAGNVGPTQVEIDNILTAMNARSRESDLHGWWNDVPPSSERRDPTLSAHRHMPAVTQPF